MARSSWPDGKVSIILLPSGRQGEAVLELAEEWTRMGLLGPALWVRPEQVHRAKAGPPRIGATVPALDREQRLHRIELDLFESLARESLALVRLVKLRSAAPSREIDAEQDEIAEHVGEYLSKSMPMSVPTASISDQVTDLSRLTLICAPTEFQLKQRVDWAASEYGTVVVASPEDRSSPWSGDAFVRDNDRFVGFALMHLASVAGLWNGTGVGSFELIPREASNIQSVWVSRVFLNAVITEALGRRTATQVLDLAAQADSLLIDPSAGSPPVGTAFIDDEMVPGYVEQMVDASMSLDAEALSFHAAPAEEAPERGRIGVGAQLRRFGAFSVDKIASMPKWTWRWLSSRTARSLTKQLQSDAGTHVVGDDYDDVVDARDAQLIARRDDLFAAERVARESMAAPVGISTLRTTPRLWARLRELVFGALDGSADLSDLGFAPIEDKVPVFGRVSDVFPSPDEVWSVQDGPGSLPEQVDWYLLAQRDPRAELVTWAEQGRAAHVQAASNAQAAEHAFRLMPEPVDAPSDAEWTVPDVPDAPAATPREASWDELITGEPEGSDSAGETAPDAADESTAETTGDAAESASNPVEDAADGAAGEGIAPGESAAASTAAAASGSATETVAEPGGDDAAEAADAESSASEPEASAQPPAPEPPAATPEPSAPASSASVPEPPAPEAPEPPAAPLTDEQVRMQREMRWAWTKARQARDAAMAEAGAAEAERRRRDDALADYDAWAVSRDRSFTWRLLARLAQDRSSAMQAVTHFTREIDRLRVPAAGELIRLRKAFHRGVLVAFGIVVLVAAVVILLPIVFDRLFERLRDAGVWYPDWWLVVVAAIVVFLLTVFTLLAAYHRGWSAFQRRVDLTHAHLDYITEAVRSARREAARLASLHRQTVDWLDLLARAIHRPWRTRPEWSTKPDYDVARASMPFAMTVGTVVERDYAAATRLRRMTTEHLVRRGWRAAAFRDLVREVGAELGQDADAFGVGALDDDLPHSSNHTRQMLRDNMAGDGVLTRVAVPRLRELVAEIQRHALHGSKPRVVSIDENPLDALAAMTDPVGGDEGTAWDDFLLDSLVGRREPVTPLSTSWLAQRQVQEGHHELVTSYLVLPDRLAQQLDFHDGAAVSTTPFRGAGRSSIDLVWRSDVVGPLPISAISLWEASSTPVAVEIDPDTYNSGI